MLYAGPYLGGGHRGTCPHIPLTPEGGGIGATLSKTKMKKLKEGNEKWKKEKSE